MQEKHKEGGWMAGGKGWRLGDGGLDAVNIQATLLAECSAALC